MHDISPEFHYIILYIDYYNMPVIYIYISHSFWFSVGQYAQYRTIKKHMEENLESLYRTREDGDMETKKLLPTKEGNELVAHSMEVKKIVKGFI